jgi:hypothetical protein
MRIGSRIKIAHRFFHVFARNKNAVFHGGKQFSADKNRF